MQDCSFYSFSLLLIRFLDNQRYFCVFVSHKLSQQLFIKCHYILKYYNPDPVVNVSGSPASGIVCAHRSWGIQKHSLPALT